MKSLLTVLFSLVSLSAVACGSSSNDATDVTSNNLEVVPSCWSPNFDQDPKAASFAGGGSSSLETVSSITVLTANDDHLVITFPEGTKLADHLDVTLPNADLTIELKAQRDHSNFLSPIVTFVPTQGHIACGPTDTDVYRCDVDSLVLAPIDAVNIDTCPTDVLPTLSVGLPSAGSRTPTSQSSR